MLHGKNARFPPGATVYLLESALEHLPDDAEHPVPPEPVHLTVEQSYTEVDELAWLGAVYDQDTGNLQLQQQGLKATRKGITLGNYQEARIRRFHLTLDDYLHAPR